MGLINFMADKLRQSMWHFLQVNPAGRSLITIDENMDFKDFECDIVILNEKDYTILVAINKSLD